jgi:hypothetical protein
MSFNFIIGRGVSVMSNGHKYSVLAAAVLLSVASLSSQAMEIEVIQKGGAYPSGFGINQGSSVCDNANGEATAEAVVRENEGIPSAISFNKLTSGGSAGSSIKVVSASETNPVSLSSPGCRFITMTIDRGRVHDGEYDLGDPDSAVKVDYVHVFTDISGQPGATVLATYKAEQGRAYVVYDKSADHLSVTFDFATTVEPLPPQWGVGYSSAYPVSITSGSIASGNIAIAGCAVAWEKSPARGTRQCQAGTVLDGTDCHVQTTCRNRPDQNDPAIPAQFGGSPAQVQKLRWNGSILTPGF